MFSVSRINKKLSSFRKPKSIVKQVYGKRLWTAYSQLPQSISIGKFLPVTGIFQIEANLVRITEARRKSVCLVFRIFLFDAVHIQRWHDPDILRYREARGYITFPKAHRLFIGTYLRINRKENADE
ncbi:hypothetical protein T230_08985 [Tannerella sp. oral taxon BU063 isolate Cell 1/3]|uniref:Uncharacterized protein n=1 Tax=Tannerella sp. oral taxon BU063 isolate Cell 1/3 TaxID=1411022 RepID=W2CIV6_9BACT|nr:hypothetical protein T230_08985 [Tannerella sp. oral taxon BU063 isolate Cell 1/3]